jgi:hypothetical protein
LESYPTPPAQDNLHVAPHRPSATWPLDARLAATWWRNPNARGIAEPDPRTVARGARPRRALASPCPHSKRRVRREREVHTQLAQVARLDAALVNLAAVWPDPEHPRALARELHAARGDRAWAMEDPNYEGRTYERRSPLYLPRRASADATRFRRAHRAAVAFVRFAERQLERESAERLRGLVAGLRPAPRRLDDRSLRTLTSVQDIRSEAKVVAASEEWKLVTARMARHFVDAPPPATT